MKVIPFLAASALSVALLLAAALPASAADPSWTCRASAGYLASPGQDRIEPLVANGNSATATASPDRPACADDNGSLGAGGGGGITQQNPFATTSIDPDREQSAAQTVTSSAGADATSIQENGFTLTAQVVRADASARCVAGQPAYTNSGQVAGVTVNGQSISADDPLTQLGDGVNGSPLGGVIHVTFNEVGEQDTPDGHTLTRRAIHVVISSSAGDTIFEAVAGEAEVGRTGDVCAPRTTSPPGACPTGSTFDPSTGYCVIRQVVPATASGQCPADSLRSQGGQCVRETLIAANGHANDQPTGGRLVPFSQVPGMAKSPCRNRRFGKKLVAIEGTNRPDRVTGTNQADRIFVLGNTDIASGGRGNDCIEGGAGMGRLDGSTGSDYLLGGASKDALVGGSGADRLFGRGGNDRLSGGLGNDRLYGAAGSDKMDGGPGNDYLDGGAGNDFITTGTGRDRVVAGPGNDVINAASAGPPAQIDCGPGRDTVRINQNELGHIRGCERVFVVRRQR
jgi:hypothetical protein